MIVLSLKKFMITGFIMYNAYNQYRINHHLQHQTIQAQHNYGDQDLWPLQQNINPVQQAVPPHLNHPNLVDNSFYMQQPSQNAGSQPASSV